MYIYIILSNFIILKIFIKYKLCLMLLYNILIFILKGATIFKYTYIFFHLSNHNPNCSLLINTLLTLTLDSHT